MSLRYKKTLLQLVLFFMSLLANKVLKAQGKITTAVGGIVTGKVLDAADNRPVGYATVALLGNDSLVFASGLTDNNGIFRLNVNKLGRVAIKTSFIGYKAYRGHVEITDKPVTDIGSVLLQADSRNLGEVVVRSKAPVIEQKLDRYVFNVENAITATGGDALDALKITPGVSVQDNQIGLIGKSSVIVMINDRKVQLSGENLTSFLSSLKNSDIKSIEVISNPPASYEAEGNSGIINIRLKTARLNAWSTVLQSSLTQNTFLGENGGATFNYNKNKISVTVSANYINSRRHRTEADQIFYPDQYWNTNYSKNIRSQSPTARLGLDYQINKLWSMGIQYLGVFSRAGVNEHDEGTITGTGRSQPDSLINTVAVSHPHVNSNSFNWHSDYKLDTTGKLLALNFDYFNYENEVNRFFATATLLPDNTVTQGSSVSTDQAGHQQVSNYSIKADLTLPYKWAAISLGGRIAHTDTRNSLSYQNTSLGNSSSLFNQNDQFDYRENIQAAYVSANRDISKKWKAQVGLRMENTDSRGSSISTQTVNNNSYLQFFPTVYTSYTLNRKNIFSFNYGRRIERPGFADLNPFKLYASTYSYSTGNPFLQPQYANVFELKYNYNSTLYTTISYHEEFHGFGSVPFVDDDTKVQYFKDINYYSFKAIGISEYYVFSVWKWWESVNQVNVYRNSSSFSAAVDLEATKGWGTYLSTNNSFILNSSGSLSAGFNYRYETAVYDLLYKKGAHSSFDPAVKYTMLKNKLQLVLSGQDVFKKDISNKITYDNNIQQIYRHYDDSRMVRLSASYRFGNNKIKANNREFGNSEEKDRVN